MFDESSLTKGQLRKLNALRRSLGRHIPDEAFARWLEQAVEKPETDVNAGIIVDTLWGLIREGKLSIQRGGYVVRRGPRARNRRARLRVTGRRLPVGWFCKGSSRTMRSVPVARASGPDRAGLVFECPCEAA